MNKNIQHLFTNGVLSKCPAATGSGKISDLNRANRERFIICPYKINITFFWRIGFESQFRLIIYHSDQYSTVFSDIIWFTFSICHVARLWEYILHAKCTFILRRPIISTLFISKFKICFLCRSDWPESIPKTINVYISDI
jgi:hypothetical protein